MRQKIQPVPPNENPQHFEGATSASKKFNFVLYAALAIIAVGILTLLYWNIANSDVLTVNNDPVPVSKVSPSPVADGQVIFRVNFCKNIGTRGVVRPSFVNPAREVFLPQYPETLEQGCRLVDVPVIIPRDLVPGKYHVHYRITYKVNPIKTVVEEFNSREFQVK